MSLCPLGGDSSSDSEPKHCLICIHRKVPGKPGRGSLDAELLRDTCPGKRADAMAWCILGLIVWTLQASSAA